MTSCWCSSAARCEWRSRRARSRSRSGARAVGSCATAGAWVAEGIVRDQFVQLTEGIIADEELSPLEPAQYAEIVAESEWGAELGVTLYGGRAARLWIELVAPDRIELQLQAEGAPLRLGLDWDRRSDERLVGLGARHGTRFDHGDRLIQLGADRRYTGPDCPPEMLADGGIPQGDCAPMPWLNSSRGYGAWIRTDANGTQFDLSGARIARVDPCRRRAAAGDAAVRADAGRAAAGVLPRDRAAGAAARMGYGFWKSRDIHEREEDVIDDWVGFRRNGIALDAIVLDSPWATQYNTWEFNPYQFPDAAGMVRRMREDGIRTVVWCTPWSNLDSSQGQIPPQVGSERLHREPASNYAEGADRGHFVRAPSGEPYVKQWWMGSGSTGRLLQPRGRALVA